MISANLEVVDKFSYLGDMLSVDGDVWTMSVSTVSTSVRSLGSTVQHGF